MEFLRSLMLKILFSPVTGRILIWKDFSVWNDFGPAF